MKMRFSKYGRIDFSSLEDAPGVADCVKRWRILDQERRDRRAADWKRVRARLRCMPERLRDDVLSFWNTCKWPADPAGLRTVIDLYAAGGFERIRAETPTNETSSGAKRNGSVCPGQKTVPPFAQLTEGRVSARSLPGPVPPDLSKEHLRSAGRLRP